MVKGINSSKEYVIVSKHWQMITQDYRCYYWVEDKQGKRTQVYDSDLVAGDIK